MKIGVHVTQFAPRYARTQGNFRKFVAKVFNKVSSHTE